MDISNEIGNFADKGQAAADKAADRVQSGIRDVKQGVGSAAASASNRVETLRSDAGGALHKASDKALGILNQGAGAVSDATRKVKDFVYDTEDSVVAYTRQKPVKALFIAAAAGAVLITLIRGLSPSIRNS
jgi:ElaB/YqjD/DUF883 family membrane-anchored ribosome-binding protein